MNRRFLWIILGVLAFFFVLGIGTVAGGTLAYFAFKAQPAQAAFSLPFFQSNEQTQSVQPKNGTRDGFLVAGVQAGSPAEAAGLQRGDILTAINDETIRNESDLYQFLQNAQAGETVNLRVLRGDQTVTVQATLQADDRGVFLGVQSCGGQKANPPQGFHWQFNSGAGAIVTQVISGSPAEQAGLQAGDRIVSVDGQALNTGEDLAGIVHNHKPGDNLTLEVQSQGEQEPHQVSVALGENPDQAGQAYLGIYYQPVPQSQMPQGQSGQEDQQEQPVNPFPNLPFNLPFDTIPQLPEGVNQAVVVGEVVPGSPAAQAGVQQGDLISQVDGQAVGTPQAVVEAVQSKKPGDTLTLTVTRQGQQQPQTLTVTLGENPDKAGQAYLGVTIQGRIQINPQGGQPNRYRIPNMGEA